MNNIKSYINAFHHISSSASISSISQRDMTWHSFQCFMFLCNIKTFKFIHVQARQWCKSTGFFCWGEQGQWKIYSWAAEWKRNTSIQITLEAWQASEKPSWTINGGRRPEKGIFHEFSFQHVSIFIPSVSIRKKKKGVYLSLIHYRGVKVFPTHISVSWEGGVRAQGRPR